VIERIEKQADFWEFVCRRKEALIHADDGKSMGILKNELYSDVIEKVDSRAVFWEFVCRRKEALIHTDGSTRRCGWGDWEFSKHDMSSTVMWWRILSSELTFENFYAVVIDAHRCGWSKFWTVSSEIISYCNLMSELTFEKFCRCWCGSSHKWASWWLYIVNWGANWLLRNSSCRTSR